MTRSVKACTPETNLAEAIAIMWSADCAALPVVNKQGTVIAMITDREIAIAAAINCRYIFCITVGEVISEKTFNTGPDDDIRSALQTMQREKVWRLPVVGADGKLQGVLSINDIVCHAEKDPGKFDADLTYEEVMGTFKAICEHHEYSLRTSL